MLGPASELYVFFNPFQPQIPEDAVYFRNLEMVSYLLINSASMMICHFSFCF